MRLNEREECLQDLCNRCKDLTDSECCSILLVPREEYRDRLHPPQSLILTTQSPALTPADKSRKFELHDKKHGGLIGGLAKEGKVIVLHGNEIIAHPFRRSGEPREPAHLGSKRSYSLLMVPIFNRKQRLRGYLKCENKKDRRGDVVNGFYDPFDQVIVRLLATQVMLALEHFAVTDVTTRILEEGHKDLTLNAYLGRVLENVTEMVGGEYGDIFWREGDKIRVLAQKGETKISREQTGLPEPSVALKVFTSGEPKLLDDVRQCAYYFKGRDPVLSEVSVPMFLEKEKERECVAVLNIESERLAVFDMRDVETLDYLVKCVTPQMVGLRRREKINASIAAIVKDLQQGKSSVLKSILHGVKDAVGFDRVRVFEYLQGKEVAVCRGSAGIGEKDDKYVGRRIGATDYYGNLTIKDVERGTIEAKIRNPSHEGVQDKNYRKFDKDPDLPWVVYPLVDQKRLYGYIAADNHTTKAQLMPLASETLGLFAALVTLHTFGPSATRENRRLPEKAHRLPVSGKRVMF